MPFKKKTRIPWKWRGSKDPRVTARNILDRLEQGDETLDHLLEKVLGSNLRPKGRDLSLLYAILYGVLRWRARLDWVIAYFSKIRLHKIDPAILNILRIGLFQIIFLERVPDAAAVNASVEMAKSVAAPWTVKYVNALLRRVTRGYATVPFPDPQDDPAAFLAIRKSFPNWLIHRWIGRFGFEPTKSLCNALNHVPPITLRVNTLKTKRETLMAALTKEVSRISPTRFAPDGINTYGPLSAVPDMAAFRSGHFQVQDEAAQLITLLLNPRSGETILDACAGLGGKTGHMAQIMKNEGRIFCVDKNRAKLHRLESEMRRMGVRIVSTITQDLRRPWSPNAIPRYDRILLDAPCSGLGVLRRNPDARWNSAKRDLQQYHNRQFQILDRLADRVVPGGSLVYAVCTTEPEENEAVLDRFLKKHTAFRIDRNPIRKNEPLSELIDKAGFFRTFPDHPEMDGFFGARLVKQKLP